MADIGSQTIGNGLAMPVHFFPRMAGFDSRRAMHADVHACPEHQRCSTRQGGRQGERHRPPCMTANSAHPTLARCCGFTQAIAFDRTQGAKPFAAPAAYASATISGPSKVSSTLASA